MDQANSSEQSGSVAGTPLSESEIRYYFTGFYKMLKRYRRMTVIGWVIVAIGCLSFPVGWSIGRPGGLIEILLSCSTVVAGLAVVWQSVSWLDTYIRIAVPARDNGERHPAVMKALEIMHDVDVGGWHEAHTAIRGLEELQITYSLPPLQ
ncbi:MAG: hypothetical protein HW412_1667 [Bacteroidetes bacterium]|nr:hypothetical protein [Bacteroidota bacterium]